MSVLIFDFCHYKGRPRRAEIPEPPDQNRGCAGYYLRYEYKQCTILGVHLVVDGTPVQVPGTRSTSDDGWIVLSVSRNPDPSRRHAFDVIIRSHILIVGVDRAVKQCASTTVTQVECRMLTSKACRRPEAGGSSFIQTQQVFPASSKDSY